MILLIGDVSDPHLLRVAQELERLGHSSRIVNLSDFGLSVAVGIELATGRGPRFQLLAKDWKLELREIKAAWIRRRRPLTIIATVPDPDDRNFAKSEWRATVDGFMSLLDSRRVINPPDS